MLNKEQRTLPGSTTKRLGGLVCTLPLGSIFYFYTIIPYKILWNRHLSHNTQKSFNMTFQSSSTAAIRGVIYPARTSRESAANDPNPIKLTDLAIKYGERGTLGRDSRNIAAGKSGLTPIELFNSAEAFPRSEKEWKDYMLASGYQRSYMKGYTTSELRDFLAIEYKDEKPSNLHEIPFQVGQSVIDISILPVIQRRNWKICVADSFRDEGHSNYFYERVDDMPPNHLDLRRRIFATTDGYMDVGCEAVWQVMQPALRLVSRVLVNAHGSHI